MDRIDECQRLLREISDLKTKLNQSANPNERRTLENEIKAKESRYNSLGCGAIDPRKPHIEK